MPPFFTRFIRLVLGQPGTPAFMEGGWKCLAIPLQHTFHLEIISYVVWPRVSKRRTDEKKRQQEGSQSLDNISSYLVPCPARLSTRPDNGKTLFSPAY